MLVLESPQEPEGEADEVEGSCSRHLGAKMGCCHASPSKGTTRYGN